VLIKLGRHFLV